MPITWSRHAQNMARPWPMPNIFPIHVEFMVLKAKFFIHFHFISVYIEVANQASMTFTFGAEVFSRSFEVRVSQYLCDSAQRPPEGCLQYHTGTDGRITSFNWNGANGHLLDQKYTICLRQELGFCCTKYQTCDGETGAFTQCML